MLSIVHQNPEPSSVVRSGSNLRWFTDLGWLALSIDYTLSSVDRHLWDIATSQVACAMAVIFAAGDHLVPPDATDRFAQQASDAGIDITSIRFPYCDHAFNLNQHGIGNPFYLGMTDQF
jgi:hypothetical protein